MKVVTAVTCPTMRIHPAIMAQAAATSAVMLPGRFEFGVGTGENLNEHIFGDRWPSTDMRLEMLERGEDKVIAAALAEGKTPAEIASFYTEAFMEDERKLNILPAHLLRDVPRPDWRTAAFGRMLTRPRSRSRARTRSGR